MSPGVRLAALFAGVSGAAVLVIQSEGWQQKTYPDPVGIPTACGGVTGAGVVAGRTYTEAECIDLTAKAMLAHALAIEPCLPDHLPIETRAAFISFTYNVGADAFCGSTLAAKARGGDLAGACAELSRWVYAGRDWLGRPKRFAGLVKRRAEERALCERGLPPSLRKAV